MQSSICSMCGKTLTDAESIKLGVGPDCAEKRQAFLSDCGTDFQELGYLALLADSTVTRWIVLFGNAMKAGNRRHAQRFLAAARNAAAPMQEAA